MPFLALPLLMMTLVAGTLAQRWMGLYDAQKTFFVAPVIWVGPLPLPGGSVLLGAIAFSLLLKFLFFSPWKPERAGSNLSHLGVLVLLSGGLFTALGAQESYLFIPQGETRNVLEDYHQRDFTVARNGETLFRIPHQDIKPGMPLPDPRFVILSNCRNCLVEKREDPRKRHKGMAAAVRLRDGPPSKQDEENLYGLTFSLAGISERIDGTYIVFDAMPTPLRLEPGNDVYEISYARRKRLLPFSVRLKQFEKEFHPGTDKPSHYASDLVIEENGLSWPARVEMNAPLRYKGYTFFQSSFVENPEGTTATVLAVVKNPSWPFPYVGSTLLAAGLLTQLVISLRKKKKWKWFSFLFLLFFMPAPANSMDLSGFGELPVLHEGRVKPLDSFARIQQRLIADNNEQNALAWLAESIFDPAQAAETPIFHVRSLSLRRQLALPDKEFYSLEEISQGLAATQKLLPDLMKSPGALAPDQKELLRLHEKSFAYSQLLGSLTMILPIAASETADDVRWIDLRKKEEDINNRVRAVIARKGENFDKFSEDEKSLVMLGMKMSQLASAGRLNAILKVIPPSWRGQTAWVAPWEMIYAGAGSPETAAALSAWRDMADGYRNGDKTQWTRGVAVAASLGKKYAAGWRLWLEQALNKLKPLLLAGVLYALALVLAAGSYSRFALWPALAGAMLHLSEIVARVTILSRPPVGTLYESMIFVGFIAAAVALFAQSRKRNRFLLGCGIFTALVTLVFAPAFAPAGDNREMLVAVLNTNFWLATHVICITAGYGVSILAATLAHMAIFRRNSRDLAPLVYKTLLGALFLMAFGTVLGGIWADQSWGRFWGWDPKENGALLIVLWIVWILHGRLGGYMKERIWLAATAALNIVVAMSWIGVNLLNIGLHSYGFTDSMAAGFGLFFLLESALILFLLQRKPQ